MEARRPKGDILGSLKSVAFQWELRQGHTGRGHHLSRSTSQLVNRATLGDLEKLPSSTITILVPGDPRFSLVPGKTIDNVHDFVEGVGANKDPIWYSKLVLGDAWPTSITFGDFNASRSEVLISDMDIVYHSMNYITESS